MSHLDHAHRPARSGTATDPTWSVPPNAVRPQDGPDLDAPPQTPGDAEVVVVGAYGSGLVAPGGAMKVVGG